MAVEVTVVARFEQSPDEDAVRNALEDVFDDCVVTNYDEEEV